MLGSELMYGLVCLWEVVYFLIRLLWTNIRCVYCMVIGLVGLFERVCVIYTWFCMSVTGCLLSIRLLWTNIRCAYCMAIRLISLNVFRACEGGILSFVSNSFIKGMWVVALAHAARSSSSAPSHPQYPGLLDCNSMIEHYHDTKHFFTKSSVDKKHFRPLCNFLHYSTLCGWLCVDNPPPPPRKTT